MPTGYDVGAAFERIEHELIDSMMRNLKRHLDEETELGFDWTQWQVQQLKYLEAYRKKNRKKFGQQFRQINLRIGHAIEHARVNGQKEEEIRILKALKEHPELEDLIGRFRGSAAIMGGNFFKINESKLKALVEASRKDLTKAEHAVLRRCDDQYRQIIYTAQVYANTGAGTVEKAVDMATHDFLARGIDSIVYKNGARHTISDYADMYIRTAERRAYLMGAGEKRKEWGMDLVIVNRRGMMTGGNFGHACPLCIPWLGKVLIDDVYSGGHPDGKHELLSTAMQQGFLHPRCKDSFTTYFPGITSVPDPVTKKELKAGAEVDRKEMRKQYAERQAEKFGRLAEYCLDPENQRMYEARAEDWKHNLDELTKQRRMSAPVTESNSVSIDWPAPAHKTTVEEFKALRRYANERNIGIAGIKDKWIDLSVAKDAIDRAAFLLEEYDLNEKLAKQLVLDFSRPMEPHVFSCTWDNIPGRIFFNSMAYGNKAALKKEYENLAEKRWFVKGTDYRSLIYHELGHIVADVYDIDGMAIAKRILETETDADTLIEVGKRLSGYAVDASDGSEIIAECFAAVYGGANNEFALMFLEECDKLISRKR